MSPPPVGGEPVAGRLAQKRFVGALVMALGAVIAFLCGLCSLYWLVNTLMPVATGRSSAGSSVLGMAILVLIVGGLPTVVGVTLFVFGLRIHREGRS